MGVQSASQPWRQARACCYVEGKMRAPDDDRVEVAVGRLLEGSGLRLALAESCTGGLVSHRITNVPGSSAYYQGAIVAYSNEIKRLVLQVRQDTLDRHGAVSEQTAIEMACGVREALGVEIGLAVTGIAGPTGGAPGKPVGTTYVALVAPDAEGVECNVWEGDRLENKTRSAEAALDLLRRYLEGRL